MKPIYSGLLFMLWFSPRDIPVHRHHLKKQGDKQCMRNGGRFGDDSPDK